MRIKTIFTAFILLSVFFIQPVFSEDSALDQNKTQILEDIGIILEGMYKTKACVTEARTLAELEKCREEVKMMRFQEVQDKLSEIGMSREERQLKKSPREY